MHPIALVGCGAISEEFYLPSLAKLPQIKDRLWIVDPSAERLKKVAEQFGLRPEFCVGSIDALPDGVKGVYNATPSHLHLQTSLALIARGAGVFVEKPFAETADDARSIIAAADGRVPLTANQFRRRYPAYGLAREMIRNGDLGAIQHIEWQEGYKFAWPTQSGFYFRRPWAGRPRGALIDTGAHVLDVICWWLNGADLDVVETSLDGFGGPEAFAAAKLSSGPTTIEIKVSFLARLANRFVVQGERGSLHGSILDMNRIVYTPKGGAARSLTAKGPSSKAEIADELIANFEQAVQTGAPLLIEAASIVPSLAAMDAIYASAEPELPAYYKDWVA